MTTLQNELRETARELIKETFGPQELPDSNKSATISFSSVNGYRNVITTSININELIRVAYTEQERINKDIRSTDVRFIGFADDFTSEPRADNTRITWDAIDFNVVSVQNIANIVYIFQARPL